jgi:hypothetical protein
VITGMKGRIDSPTKRDAARWQRLRAFQNGLKVPGARKHLHRLDGVNSTPGIPGSVTTQKGSQTESQFTEPIQLLLEVVKEYNWAAMLTRNLDYPDRHELLVKVPGDVHISMYWDGELIEEAALAALDQLHRYYDMLTQDSDYETPN